ncbi:hypothetical protein BKA16_002166 [Gordonia humi]|uniref:Uncharacterized protein n=1 Tax=Gordonia humi TaxID=686429 RepID=A0A840EZ68_9ACTN|nr:hypothetical protein [Gordonia humi]
MQFVDGTDAADLFAKDGAPAQAFTLELISGQQKRLTTHGARNASLTAT